MNLTRRFSLLFALAALALALAAAPALAAPKAYVLNYGTNTVAPLDTQTNQFVGPEIPVREGPYSIAVTPDGKTAYEISESDKSLSVINLQTNQVVGEPLELGTSPYVIAISPDGKTAYIHLRRHGLDSQHPDEPSHRFDSDRRRRNELVGSGLHSRRQDRLRG